LPSICAKSLHCRRLIIVYGRVTRHRADVSSVPRSCKARTSPTCDSSQTTQGTLTPEPDSSQDSLPALLPATTACSRIKSDSPSVEPAPSGSSFRRVRPTTKEPLDVTLRKRSERCQGPTVSANDRQHRTRREDCSPVDTCQRRESWQFPRGQKLSR
jgi:hypothetical protein